MPAASYNFSIEQGSDFQVVFQYIDENNKFVNLTNYYIVLKFITNNNIIYTFDNMSQSIDYKLVGNTLGKITLDIPARITNTYTFTSAVYDLDIQEPNEQYPGSGYRKYRLSQGSISIVKRNIPTTITDIPLPIDRANALDACEINCSPFESTIYTGSGISIIDNDTSLSSIFISDNRSINTIELAINGLSHSSPQDINAFLAPPSGDKILLFSNQKMSNYTPGFSFLLSEKALPESSLYTVKNGGSCRITNKTNSTRFNNSIPSIVCDNNGCNVVNIPYNVVSSGIEFGALNNENLLSSFVGLSGYVPSSGNWTLYLQDNDIGSSGVIDSWKLIITYND